MKLKQWTALNVTMLFFGVVAPAGFGAAPDAGEGYYAVSPGALQKVRARVTSRDEALQPALKRLLQEADRALKAKPLSVMDKPKAAESGDKHDYFSTAPYFWPDPAKKDGLPYMRKDGKVNPESHNEYSDSPRLGQTARNCETLALAYYFTGNEVYAEQAATLLRTWFIEADTRMNPNFRYAQAVPGVNSGRGTGMIESRSLATVCDAVGLLKGSPNWSKADQEAMVQWMRAFLDWAQTSKNGTDEQKAKNNHGSFYDMQVAHFALFIGKKDLAKRIIESAKERRIAVQIKTDGSQPLELARADSFGYSRFNVQALFELATLGEHVGVDLWHYESPEGGSLRKALDFLMPYVEDRKKPWPYEHGKKSTRSLSFVLRQAYVVYGDERYLKALEKTRDYEEQRDTLLFPLK